MVAIILLVVGVGLYSIPVLWRTSRTPALGSYFFIGPDLSPDQNVTWSRLEVSLTSNSMTFEVVFTITKLQDYYVDLILPYVVTFSQAGLGEDFLTHNQTAWESVAGGHRAARGGSVVWLNYHPWNVKSTPWEAHVGLYIETKPFELSYRPGSKTFAMILFAKYPSLHDEQTEYLHSNTTYLAPSNFTLRISFDPAGEIGAGTYPTPVAYFVSSDYKSATWILNLHSVISENRGQGVQLSVEYPSELQCRDTLIFLGGLFIGTGLSLTVESHSNDEKKSSHQPTRHDNSPSFLRVMASDLRYLYEDWDETADEDSLRRSSPVLRRLLVEGDLLRAWRQLSLPGQPIITAPTLKGDLGSVQFAQAGGAGLGSAARLPRPPSPSDKKLKLSEFLESPCLVLRGNAFSRREVVKYVANKLGGCHFDKKRDARLIILDELHEKVKWANGLDAIYHELLSIGKVLTSAPDIQNLRKALSSALAKP